MSTLDALQAREQKAMTDEVNTLRNEISKVASPFKSTKTDLDRWRELFDIYLQAEIFFSTIELDHGSRNSIDASEATAVVPGRGYKEGPCNVFQAFCKSRCAL